MIPLVDQKYLEPVRQGFANGYPVVGRSVQPVNNDKSGSFTEFSVKQFHKVRSFDEPVIHSHSFRKGFKCGLFI